MERRLRLAGLAEPAAEPGARRQDRRGRQAGGAIPPVHQGSSPLAQLADRGILQQGPAAHVSAQRERPQERRRGLSQGVRDPDREGRLVPAHRGRQGLLFDGQSAEEGARSDIGFRPFRVPDYL